MTQTNLPVRRAQNGLARMDTKGAVQQQMARMLQALPQGRKANISRFQQAALSLASNPNIAACTPNSVVKCIYECARLNLIPDPILKLAYVVPFKVKGVPTATLIVGYGGLIELARRACRGLFIQTGTVHANDDYILEEGLEPKFKITRAWWQKGMEEPGVMVFSYCISKTPEQSMPLFKYLPHHEAMEIAKSSRSGYRAGVPWFDDFEAMAEKTCIRRSAKLWSLASESEETHRFREAMEYEDRDPDDMLPPEAGDIEPPTEDLPAPGEQRIGNLRNQPAQTTPPPPPEDTDPTGNLSASDFQTQEEDIPYGTDTGGEPPPPAPKPQQAPPAAPAATKPTRNESSVKAEIAAAVDKKLNKAGCVVNSANSYAVLAKLSKSNNFAADYTNMKLGALLILLGEVNALADSQVAEIVGAAPEETAPAPASQPERDTRADITAEELVEAWAYSRRDANLPLEKVRGAVSKYVKMKFGKALEVATPDELGRGLAQIVSGVGMRWSLFEG